MHFPHKNVRCWSHTTKYIQNVWTRPVLFIIRRKGRESETWYFILIFTAREQGVSRGNVRFPTSITLEASTGLSLIKENI